MYQYNIELHKALIEMVATFSRVIIHPFRQFAYDNFFSITQRIQAFKDFIHNNTQFCGLSFLSFLYLYLLCNALTY